MRRAVIGEGTYVVADRRARRRLRQLLDDEYQRIEGLDLTGAGSSVRVHVGWWASGQVRRLRPDRPIVVASNNRSVELPFNPCIGEFLFGAPVYAIRRGFLDAEAARSRGEIPATSSTTLPPVEDPMVVDPDAGSATTDAGPVVPDAAVTGN